MDWRDWRKGMGPLDRAYWPKPGSVDNIPPDWRTRDTPKVWKLSSTSAPSGYVVLDVDTRHCRRPDEPTRVAFCRGEDLPKPMPDRLLARSTRKTMVDYAIAEVLPVVSHRFRDIVERLEPGVHGFHPVIVERARDGMRYEGEFFWFQVRQFGDFEDVERSSLVVDPNENYEMGYWVHTHGKNFENRYVAFSRALLQGRRIWQGRLIHFLYILVDPTIHDAFVKAKLRGFAWSEYDLIGELAD